MGDSGSRTYGFARPPTGKSRRTIRMMKEKGVAFLTPPEILKILKNYAGIYSLYSSPNRIQELYRRDLALASFITISCSRIGEPLRLTRGQIDLSRLDYVLIRNYKIEKTKKFSKQGNPVPPFFLAELPLTMNPKARLYPFTQMFLDHALSIEDPERKLFPIGTRRANQIITGMDPRLFPHFIRGSMLTYYLNAIKNPMLVAKIFGIRAINTLEYYYGGVWESASEELSA